MFHNIGSEQEGETTVEIDNEFSKALAKTVDGGD